MLMVLIERMGEKAEATDEVGALHFCPIDELAGAVYDEIIRIKAYHFQSRTLGQSVFRRDKKTRPNDPPPGTRRSSKSSSVYLHPASARSAGVVGGSMGVFHSVNKFFSKWLLKDLGQSIRRCTC